MSWFQKTITFIGLTVLFLFAYNANEGVIEKKLIEKSAPFFNHNTTHFPDCIQPRNIASLISIVKKNDLKITKYFHFFLVTTPSFNTLKTFDKYLSQDINRCKNVSILLFPFHIFW